MVVNELTTPAQQKAINVTIGLGVAIIIIAGILAWCHCCHLAMIPIPNIPKVDTTLPIATQIKNYTDLTAAKNTNTKFIYDMLVTNTLLPIFKDLLTAVISLIFLHNGGRALKFTINKFKS